MCWMSAHLDVTIVTGDSDQLSTSLGWSATSVAVIIAVASEHNLHWSQHNDCDQDIEL